MRVKQRQLPPADDPNYDYDPYERAEALGLRVVTPTADELQLDIDTGEQLAIYERNIDVLRKWLQVHEISRTPSQEEGHLHITLQVADRPLTAIERIALQAALGSDPKRELLSIMRAWYNEGVPPTLFFEKKTTATNTVVTELPF